MKAIINGIQVEGTPEEILYYQELVYGKNTKTTVDINMVAKELVDKIQKTDVVSKTWTGNGSNPYTVKFM